MALGGRSPRRSPGSRVLVVALVVTVVVLLIDASIKSRSPSTGEHLSAQAWVDQVLPLIRDSTEQGQQIYRVRTTGVTLAGSTIASEVNQTAAAAAATYRDAEKLVAPSTLGTAGGLFDACLLLRKQAAASVAKAFVAALSGPPTPSPATSAELAAAGQKLASGDVLYQLFTQNLPGVGIKMPASVWDRDATLYQSPVTTDYLTALRSKTNLSPVTLVKVQSITTNPLPERVETSGVEVLPAVGSISVGVTVANLGNQTERDLTVTATDLPAIKYPSVQVQLAPLQPGAAQSVTLGPLYPVAGTPVTLTIKVSGPASPAPLDSKTLTLEMPSASSPLTSTTSTTVVAPSGTTTSTSSVSSSGSGTGG